MHAVEDALFETTCTSAEPSLHRLLSQDAPDAQHGLSWQARVQLPRTYAIVTTDRDGASQWAYYKGHNHAWDKSRGRSLTKPYALANSDGATLLATHGVILERAQGDYAWIFVNDADDRKLRIPSIVSATLSTKHAVITTLSEVVTVDLTTGTLQRTATQ